MLIMFEPAKYVDLKAQSEGDFLAERTSRKKRGKSRSKSGEVDYRDPVVYKAGPREIGTKYTHFLQSIKDNFERE